MLAYGTILEEKGAHSARSECSDHIAHFLIWRASARVTCVHGHDVVLCCTHLLRARSNGFRVPPLSDRIQAFRFDEISDICLGYGVGAAFWFGDFGVVEDMPSIQGPDLMILLFGGRPEMESHLKYTVRLLICSRHGAEQSLTFLQLYLN
jgi:hypothetical protein